MQTYRILAPLLAFTIAFSACNNAEKSTKAGQEEAIVDSISMVHLPDSAISENLNIQETGTELRMVVLNEVLFEEGTAKIQEEGQHILEQAAILLNTRGDGKVMITGNSGSEGDSEENLNLSKERAKVVFDFLNTQTLKTGLNLQYQGVGNQYPMMEETNADGTPNERNKRINQRVEIVSRRLQQ